jgi:alanyl-tRNA synthetase
VQQLGLKAGSFIGEIAKLTGGGGGGRPNLAQAGGKQPEQLPKALRVARERLQAELISR